MSDWQLWMGDALVIIGTAAMTLSIVGVLRIPNTYAKLHAASKAVVLGVLVVLSASILTWQWELSLRALLVGAFLLLTTTASSHALARLHACLMQRQKER